MTSDAATIFCFVSMRHFDNNAELLVVLQAHYVTADTRPSLVGLTIYTVVKDCSLIKFNVSTLTFYCIFSFGYFPGVEL